MEHAEYVRKHGDPVVNGRGDKIARGPQGQKLVQMKVDAMWVKRKKWINQVQKHQCLVASSDDLANEMVHCQFEALGGTSDSACDFGSGVAIAASGSEDGGGGSTPGASLKVNSKRAGSPPRAMPKNSGGGMEDQAVRRSPPRSPADVRRATQAVSSPSACRALLLPPPAAPSSLGRIGSGRRTGTGRTTYSTSTR